MWLFPIQGIGAGEGRLSFLKGFNPDVSELNRLMGFGFVGRVGLASGSKIFVGFFPCLGIPSICADWAAGKVDCTTT